MKAKIPFDSEFAGDARRQCWPIRAIGPLMFVAALSGLMIWAGPMMSGAKAAGPPKIRRAPAGRPAQAWVGQPRDRFVIAVRPDLDAAMVIPVDPDLDAAMVIHPGTGGRSLPMAPRLGGALPAPGQAPAPVPDRGGPHDWSSPPRVNPRAIPR
jgi:hypothetical protein